MFKWVEIALKNNRLRYEELSQFLSENQFENEVEFRETTESDFPQVIEECISKYDGIRIGQGFGENVLSFFERRSVMTNKIKAADAIVKRHNQWWLQSNAVDGFSRVLRKVGELFDLDSAVLIVGAGAAARVAVTSLFIAGFKKFSISALDEAKAESFVRSMKGIHFSAIFQVVPKDGLILLPGVHGIMVNTTPLIEDNPMLEELYYFNFFKSGGVAIDFSVLPVETPLLKEAKDVGAECLYGYQISAYTDLIWCEQITGRKMPEETYEARLGERLRRG